MSGLAAADPTGSESAGPEAAGSSTNVTETDKEAPFSFADLKKQLKAGRFWMNFRYRFENVDQNGLPKDAAASTLRTRLGYESAEYNGWTGLIEFSDVANVGAGASDYNDTINGKTDRPVVADPTGTVVNQVYAKYDDLWGGTFKLGRQRIALDNHRFIGSVAWRQTEQTFDAVSFVQPDIQGATLIYAYIDHINRIFGPNSAAGDLDSNSHALNVSKSFDDVGKLTAYGYYLDVPSAKALNTFSYGLRFDGAHDFDKWTMLYTAELAHQSDVASNPNKVSAGYLHAVFGGKYDALTLKGGYEVLDGANNAGGQFQTPLSTLHAHNGWADKFLSTPQSGLEDLYLSAGYDLGESTDLLAVYHDFSAERGGAGDYGTELDLQAVHHFDFDVDLGVKFADYDAKNFATDTQKFWIWLYYSF